MLSIRLARVEDAHEVAEIYAPIVRETAVSFEEEPPDAREIARRISETLPEHPWLVAEEAGRIVGYAYAVRHRARAAYRWSVEVSVYVAPESRNRGVGRALYGSLFAVLRAQGFANAYAVVVLPNPASVAFHGSFGFEEVGTYRRAGFKRGRWHDVWWGGLDLMPGRRGNPARPRTVAELEASGELAGALAVPGRGTV